MTQATLVSREENTARIDITVPAAKVEAALSRIYAQLADRQKIKGFRRGKVPRNILDNLVGAEGIHAQALQDIVPDAWGEAMDQLDVTPIGSPNFDPEPAIEEGKDLLISVKVDVLPEVRLPDLASINLDIEKDLDAKPEEVDDAVMSIRKRRATYTDADRPCAEGDRITIDYNITVIDIAGKAPETEYDKREGVVINIGEQEMLPDIENNIVGLKPGEEKKFIVKYPENYQNPDIAGKSTSVQVKVHKVSARQLPELDEEFIKSVGEYANADDMKKDVEKRLLAYKKMQFEELVRTEAAAQVVTQTHLDVPESLVDEEVEYRTQYLKHMLESQGKTFEQALAEHNDTEEEYLKREKASATVEVKRRIVFGEIFRNEKMEITTDELLMAISAYARENNLKKSDTKKLVKDRDQIAAIRNRLKNMKVLQLLASRAKCRGEWGTGAPAETEQA